MIQAGVSQSEAMSISQHKTDSVFRRYDIVDTQRKGDAMTKVGAFAAKHVRKRRA
jgi:hypothetical protein